MSLDAFAHFLVSYFGGGYKHAAAEIFGPSQRFFAFAAAGTAGYKNHFRHLGHLFPPLFKESRLIQARHIPGHCRCVRQWFRKDPGETNAKVLCAIQSNCLLLKRSREGLVPAEAKNSPSGHRVSQAAFLAWSVRKLYRRLHRAGSSSRGLSPSRGSQRRISILPSKCSTSTEQC